MMKYKKIIIILVSFVLCISLFFVCSFSVSAVTYQDNLHWSFVHAKYYNSTWQTYNFSSIGACEIRDRVYNVQYQNTTGVVWTDCYTRFRLRDSMYTNKPVLPTDSQLPNQFCYFSMSSATTCNAAYVSVYFVPSTYNLSSTTISPSVDDYLYYSRWQVISGKWVQGEERYGTYFYSGKSSWANVVQVDVILKITNYFPANVTPTLYTTDLYMYCGLGDRDTWVNNNVKPQGLTDVSTYELAVADFDQAVDQLLSYISNPTTTFNYALSKADDVFLHAEIVVAFAMIDSFLGIPIVNALAWFICVFGTIFSLFNVGVSFLGGFHLGRGGKK